jgi:hypothetical protein
MSRLTISETRRRVARLRAVIRSGARCLPPTTMDANEPEPFMEAHPSPASARTRVSFTACPIANASAL